MLRYLPTRLLWHSFNTLTRWFIAASGGIALLLLLLILILRFLLLPNIELQHERIAASLAVAIGSPVTIGRIEGDWLWLQPRLSLVDVHILNEQRQSALVLPRIEGILSWSTLFAAELRLASLEIDRPELLVLRDATGKVFIGGVMFSRQGEDNDLSDWLLHQSRMVVKDALIVWIDQQRDAQPLVLQRVNLRIENLFSHHRFALRAEPSAALASPLDLRGDFYGASFDDLSDWHGQLYTQLEHTEVQAWRPWLTFPEAFSKGGGAVRAWISIEKGKISGVIADLRLSEVATRLASDLPEMKLQDLKGRASWKIIPGGMEVYTKGLTLHLQNGLMLQPADFYFRSALSKQLSSNEIRANLLQLESLAGLANFLPLPPDLRAKLNVYAPKGRVTDLDVQWQEKAQQSAELNILNYKIKGKFENMALRQVGSLPGISGLSVVVDGNELAGTLKIDSRRLGVDAPGVMREALFFATVSGQANWMKKNDELLVTVENVAVANEDLAGNLHGSYQTKTGTLGLLDLSVSLTRGDIRRAARYTPLIAVGKESSDWLQDALLAGHTEDFYLRINGNLSDFPLDSREKALFEIGGHARDVVLEYDKSWPRIEHISGELLIHGNKLQVKAPEGTLLGAKLKNVLVTLPDMMSADLPLDIKGEALGTSSSFLKFIQKSPVRGYIDGFTDDMSASGNGHLDLSLHIPLLGEKPVIVNGLLRVQDNDIDLGEGAPMLRKTRGELAFTESGLEANGVSAEILGGAASINVKTAAGGAIHAVVKGRSNLEVLKKLNPHPLLNYLNGSTTWDADISVTKKATQISINSNLQGLGSNLPQPLTKRAVDAMPLRFEKKIIDDEQDVLKMQLGKLFSARLARHNEKGERVIKRGAIYFGADNTWPETSLSAAPEAMRKSGIRVSGSLPELSLEGWSELLNGTGGGDIPFASAELLIAKVRGYGAHFDNLHIDASRLGNGLVMQLSSSALNGELDWQPKGEGKLTAKLQNLYWNTEAVTSKSLPPVKPATPGSLPALQISIENFQLEGKSIGRVEMVGHPDAGDWRLRRLNIVNPDGTLTGDGLWRGAQTQLNLLLQISDAGKVLARSGYPNTVKGGSGKLSANLSWAGGPGEFGYAGLDGSLKLDTSKGQFLKMDPGIGKLLGILSLQALPKRITLDFTDVFSEGFQFDNINGNASIKKGLIDTQDFHIDGSAAKVTMKGNIDLNGETQNLRVRILPTLGDSVSLLGAFAAGPLAGIGTLLINKVLGNPLDKLASFEYNVSGTWSDPKVVKLGATSVNAK